MGPKHSRYNDYFREPLELRAKQISLEKFFMSRKTAYCSVVLVLACCAGLVGSSSAQEFLQVKGTLTSVSAGRNEIFGVDSKAAVWRYHPTTRSFGKVPHVFLASVAVGGGTALQLDEVWGLDVAGGIYQFDYSTKTFNHLPGLLSQIAVGVGYQDNCHPYEVWGVDSSQLTFRYNYCTDQFDEADNGFITQVAKILSNQAVADYIFLPGMIVCRCVRIEIWKIIFHIMHVQYRRHR